MADEGLIAAKAWSRLDVAGIHKQMAPGNHDWVDGGGFGFARDDAHLDGVWTGDNPFSASGLASVLGSGMSLAGSDDMAYWGGSYNSTGANTYTTMDDREPANPHNWAGVLSQVGGSELGQERSRRSSRPRMLDHHAFLPFRPGELFLGSERPE